MKKLKTLKTIATPLAICALFLFGIGSSEADFEIEEVRSYYYNYELYDTGGGVSHYTYAKTSEPFYSLAWYVDGVYAGSNYGGHAHTETSNYFYVGEGTISGTSYTIKADACLIDDDGNTFYAINSYNVTVYKPKYKTTPIHEQDLLFVRGYVEISKQTYDDNSGSMSFAYYVSAVHTGTEADGEVRVATEYKASFPELNLENKDWRPHVKRLEPTDSWDTSYYNDSGSLDITLEGGVSGLYYGGEAYVRLKVSGRDGTDDYHITNMISCQHR